MEILVAERNPPAVGAGIPNEMDQGELKNQLEIASRVGAALIIIFYVLGFLVVTFQNASRGIVSFGLFRAKVLAAGILFSVFLVLPLLSWSTIFFPKLGQGAEAVVAPDARARFYLTSARLLWFFISSLGGALILFFFVFHRELSRGLILLWIALAAATVTAAMFCRSRFSKYPVACSVLPVTIMAAAAAGLVFLKERELEIILGWFVFVSYQAHSTRKEFREAPDWRYFNWQWMLVYVLLALAFFGVGLYPKLDPSIGGGKPTRAVFQFANSSPIDNSSKEELWLLDEVDAGYYVLRSPEEHKAVFVPRSLVSAIYFDADESAKSSKTKP